MVFIKCGSKLFDPKAVAAVVRGYDGACHSVTLSIPGGALTFRDDEAEAVWAYFLSIPLRDLMQRDEGEAPEAGAPNHSQAEC